jgi:hypothetical protein
MCKEQLDKTEQNKKTLWGSVLKTILNSLVVVGILWGIIIVAGALFVGVGLTKSIITSSTIELIEPDTNEKENYIIDIFHIKDTDNIGSYTISFYEGCKTVILNDVKDIHTLCFENLAEYGITEDDYNEIISIPFDERDYVKSYAALKQYDGIWRAIKHKGVKLVKEINSQDYHIIIYEMDTRLYCEVSTGWGKLEDLKKLRSMK